jgi:hypothetical protein
MTYQNDPHDPRYEQPRTLHDVQQEVPVQSPVSKATWAGIAIVVLVLGGIAVWAYSSQNPQSASVQPKPGVEQTVPPATSGQGGAASKMPPAKDAQ